MKVELHCDYTLKQTCDAIPRLVETMRCANAFAIIKELYEIGEMSKEDYGESLRNLLEIQKFKCK